ncbi:glycoside hydrolase family 18 protein [Elizabethkingia argenteiflava]|uniref:hypothetical protein n=1 Tax=Elizabethkingia argenteiflava TaxID=2681556 RepID=UPI001FCE47C0|nr:hypothetical protein [Elizabethkingia argenteiflava]
MVFFFDDEYSSYQSPPPRGFVTPSNNAAARLCYETKKAVPNKLVSVYVYNRTASFPDPVEGKWAGNFIDYAIQDYGVDSDLSSNYPGLPRSRMAISSQEFVRNIFASPDALRNLRNSGYGAHMIFSMDPYNGNFRSLQLPALQLLAKELYSDELVYSETPFAKDW